MPRAELGLGRDGRSARLSNVELEVRRIRPEEGPALRSIRLAALQDSPSAYGSSYGAEIGQPDAFWAERAGRSAAGDAAATFLALADGRAVGLVGAFRPDPDGLAVELVSMWASPDVRRHGVGRSLVDAVVEWADSASATSVDLWVTRGNEPAQRMYEAAGFRATGEHQPLPSDPCKDELRMTRPLDQPLP